MDSNGTQLAEGTGSVKMHFECNGGMKWETSDGAEYTKLFCIVRRKQLLNVIFKLAKYNR